MWNTTLAVTLRDDVTASNANLGITPVKYSGSVVRVNSGLRKH
jgi:hypothetical protein